MAEPPLWARASGERFFARLPVAETLSGNLALPLHALVGSQPGPTLGITATVHGDETLPAMMVRQLFRELDPAQLRGCVCAVTVGNPLALAAFDRQTPEQHGKTDLHEVFPGSRGGNLTQKMAHAIATGLLDHVDAHIDYHCGGAGGRLQERVDFDTTSAPEVRSASLELARAFGTVIIHESNIAGSAVRYVNGRGKPAFNAETSGVYLGPGATRYYMDAGVAGLRRVLVALGILAGEPAAPARQACFGAAHRREVNPTRGGFLVSQFEEPEQLGTRVAAGTTLGEIVDLHTLETVEALVAPVDGYLFFSRYSGVVDAGTKAFALADEAGVQWLE